MNWCAAGHSKNLSVREPKERSGEKQTLFSMSPVEGERGSNAG